MLARSIIGSDSTDDAANMWLFTEANHQTFDSSYQALCVSSVTTKRFNKIEWNCQQVTNIIVLEYEYVGYFLTWRYLSSHQYQNRGSGPSV